MTLVISVIYLAILVTPQPIQVPGLPVEIEGGFALALLGAIYVAVGGIATFVAERANGIAGKLGASRPVRFKALRLGPSIGTIDVPVVRFLVSFVPAAIFASHLGYLGYKASNGGVALPIIFYPAVGGTLWQLLPVGKRALTNLAKGENAS